ncbi:hypothetical protein SSX86_002678 [Deinandra increscens subsp. villosa]|uniref:Uncharacterized protein n=1 Tax=Deinandra increscens subsp. villosa TaxID=3103831 RepID=A0AAP0DPK6_9ASTR
MDEHKSTDEVNFEMRRSFSWDRAFFTSDGFLNAEELSNVIEGGGGDDVKQELQKIEEIESMEAKLFQEIEASDKKSTGTSKVVNSSSNMSSRKKDSRAKKTRSSPSSGGSGGCVGNKVRSSARRSTSSKTAKATPGSPSKTSSVGITTKNKVPVTVNTHMSRTPPASPVSSGSPSSKFPANQWSKKGSSVPSRSSVNSEKPTAVNARRNDEWKASKPAVRLIPKTQSSISLKVKPPPVISHPSPTSGFMSSSSSSTAQCRSESSPTCAVNQRSKSKGSKGSTVHHKSKSSLKNHPTGQTPDRNRKQPAASRSEPRSPNASKPRKLLASKPVAAVSTGLKPVSQKTATPKPSKKQSGAKAKSSGSNSRGAENIILVSPEVMDIKGKLNALKMEISMQKKDRCKETKGKSSSIIPKNNQTKST